jgi:Nuclear pore complex scaffold, nucleoporins 186/192/205
LPPNSTSFEQLNFVTERLSLKAVKSWNRPDIVGMIMASYAVLLQSSTVSLSSPRSHQSPGNASDIEARKVLRECISAPAQLRAFTFGRYSLIASLRQPINADAGFPVYCDVSSFLMISLSDFFSRYLDLLCSSSDRPISKAKWTQDTEDTIALEKSYEEQQRRFQGQFSVFPTGNSGMSDPGTPETYEIPDCLDDAIGFATELCSFSPEYAIRFWSQQEYSHEIDGKQETLMKLVPSLTFKELEHQQTIDHSLRPVFISFLAALATARNDNGSLNGADTIHEIFSTSIADDGNMLQQSWISILEILRIYVRELDPSSNSSPSESRTRSNDTSTAYYYYDESSNTPDEAVKDANTTISQKELGDENIAILSSHLTLISNVAFNSPQGRYQIVSNNYLPIRSADFRDVIGRDSPLDILWMLSRMPLPPGIRGMVFKSIASLLSVDGITDTTERSKLREFAVSGWEVLEASQIVPIRVLHRYQIEKKHDEINPAGLSFPMSLLSLVSLPILSFDNRLSV